jgi:hypothetical protein
MRLNPFYNMRLTPIAGLCYARCELEHKVTSFTPAALAPTTWSWWYAKQAEGGGAS